MTRYGTTMSEALAEVREGFSPKQIKMAIGIASDKRYAGVNMSGAVRAIEKIKRGLADHPQVAAVLKAKNEDTEPQESVQEVSEMPQESVPVYEGKMKELHGYISKGKTAEWIANKMGFSVKDIKSLMDEEDDLEEASKEGTIRIIDLGNRNQDKIRKDLGVDKLPNKGFQVQVMTKGKFVNVSTPYKTMKDAEKVRKSGQHSLGLDEKYDLYHKTFSGAMQHSYEYSKKKFGIEIDPNEIDDKVATGPAKPKTGKTNSYRLKGKDGKKGIQVQVYNTGKSFELNMYKEEVELEEAINFDAASKSLEDYAKKSGGIDKTDFQKVAAYVRVIGKNSSTKVQDKAFNLMKKFVSDMDTDPRDGVIQILQKHGMYKNGRMMQEGTWLPDAELNEMKMNDPKLLKVFDNLKKGSTVKIKHDSTLEKGKDFIEYIVKSKNMVNKGRVEKITLATKGNPTSVKKFLYKRDEKVTMAMGDMAVSPVDIKEEGLREGPEVYTVKKGKFARKVDGKTADKMKKDGWKLISAEDDKASSSAKTRIAQLQLQIAKSQETINKLKET